MNIGAQQRRYSFVTIAFEGDAGLLRLQARSMRRYCPDELIEDIIIVDNSSRGATSWLDTVLPQYGGLADRIKIIPAEEIADIPVDADGWFTQQVLKIEVAALVRTDRFVLLDSKDHLVRDLTRDFLETPLGLPRTNGYSYTNQPMREVLERTLAYLDLDTGAYLDWFTRTTTPFIMLTEQACELVRFVEEKEAKPFSAAFLERGLSEFFLYSGYLASREKLFEMHDLTQPNGPTVWVDKADVNGCIDITQKARRAKSPFMAVHRKAIARLEPAGRRVLAEFWHERGLFASEKDGVRFLEDPNWCRQGPDGRVHPPPIGRIAKRFAVRLARIRLGKDSDRHRKRAH